MKQGFLRISRNIVDWDWYTDANTFRVFMHLLLTANYKDCNYKGVVVKRGQVATSRMEIAKALRMSEQNVRTSLSHLKSTSEITSKSTNKLTIITLCKYDSWQDWASESNQQTNREPTDNLTVNQPTIEEESNNNNNNNNKEKEDTKVSPKKKIDYQAIVDCWNEHNGKKLGKVTKITERRKKAIKKALDDNGITQEQLMLFFKTLPHADKWLYNPNKQHANWKPDFDWWLSNPNGWLTKGLEGKVHLENPQVYSSIMLGKDATYTPQGRTIWYDENTKAYWTDDNFYYGVISDGYTDEDRPDGATLTMNNARGIITWNSSTKKWEKQ